MTSESVLKSTCELCNKCCGVLIYLKDSQPARVEKK